MFTLLQCAVAGLSAWEISDVTKRLVHAVRPRLCELKAMGLIREHGRRWEPRTERHEVVYVANKWDDSGQIEFV